MIKLLTLITLATLSLYAQTFNVSTTPELRTALNTAATNGEDDTIILADGTYKTTDDGNGTFKYVSNEANKLTLKGSSSANVILSGDHVEQIFNHNSTEHAPLKLEKLTFVDGNNTSGDGGGVYTDYIIDVVDCNFSNNSANRHGGGFFSSGSVKASNLLLLSNSSGIYISRSDDSKIYNSIFKDNNTSDIDGSSSTIIFYLDNNYIDISKVNVSNFPKNNIFSGVNLGFVDEANGDYNLTVSSDLIDAGTTVVDGITLPTTDLNGNARIAGANIDIGPYEFSTTRPTIKSFNYTGIAKETKQLTFSVDYNLTDGRTLSDIMYDYTNDGSWTVDNNHTYNIAGVYIVKVKVTDDSGEYSTRKLTVNIAQSTLTDKLLTTLTQAQIDTILPMINSDKDTAVSEAHTSGVTVGENNVVLDPASYNLVSQTALADMNTTATTAGIDTGKQLVLTTPSAFGLVTTADLNSSIATATASGVTSGKEYVKSHPSEFGLVTKSAYTTALTDMNTTAITAGQNLVIASPSAYGLVSSADVNSSVSEALSTGTASGKEYVKAHPSEFGLVTKSNIEVTATNISSLSSGWTLMSTPFAITDMSLFDSASIIWIYNNSTTSWSAYSSNATTKQAIIDKVGVSLLTSIPAGSGIWVHK